MQHDLIYYYYTYIAPNIAVFATLYIIYLFVTKKQIFNEIENDFYESIKHNQELSNEANHIHFTQAREKAQRILDNFNQRLEESIQKNDLKIEEQNTLLEKLAYSIKSIEKQLLDCNGEITKRDALIRQKDAIIDKKNKQIKRLKEQLDEKN